MQGRCLGYTKVQRIPPDSVATWIGISLDEALRQKPSRYRWITNRWPLIEKRMTRGHCLEWQKAKGYPNPPKSSYLGCPYHSDSQWLEIKHGDQDEWLDTVIMDRHIRSIKRMNFEQFMHRSLRPLDECEFTTNDTLDMFKNECEGICGV